MKITHAIKAKIQRIQRSDDITKKRWQIVLTSITMIVVILLWLGYVSVTIPRLEGAPESDSREENMKESFFTVFGRGLTIISGNVKDQLKKAGASVQGAMGSFEAQIKQGNEYTIERETE